MKVCEACELARIKRNRNNVLFAGAIFTGIGAGLTLALCLLDHRPQPKRTMGQGGLAAWIPR